MCYVSVHVFFEVCVGWEQFLLSCVLAVACHLLFYALLCRIRFRGVICFECQLPCSFVRRLSLHCAVTAAIRPLHCPAP